MKWAYTFTLLALLAAVWGVCGDLICKPNEAGILFATYNFRDATVRTYDDTEESEAESDFEFLTSSTIIETNCEIALLKSHESHRKVMRLNSTDPGNRVYLGGAIESTQASGTIEFWEYHTDFNRIAFFDSSSTRAIYESFSGNDNQWNHVRIDFECGGGGYQGLSADTYDLYIDGALSKSGESFENPISAIDYGLWGALYTDSSSLMYFDAIGYSWDPGYSVGNNRKVCTDCAMRQRNYVCDSFPLNMHSYDPDCNTSVGQDCYDSYHEYSGGRGDSCYPGRCEEGTGCTTACTSGDQCQSGFCSGSNCAEVCDGCEHESANYAVEPLSTTIYLGSPTFVSFQVNLKSATDTLLDLSADGPCTLECPDTVEVGSGYGVVVVKVSNCTFTGLGSVRLEASGDSAAWSTAHILSYPSLKYEQGEMPSGTVGYSAMSGRAGNAPMEVKTWVG